MTKGRDWDDIRPLLDWDAIAAAITTTRGRELSNFEREDAMKLVFLGAERWLPRDLVDMKIEGIEEEIFVNGLPEQRKPFHGFVDLRGTVLPTAGEPYNGKNPWKQTFYGDTVICDWKTTEKAVDSKWKSYLKKSWQFKLYAFATNATLFSYRGMSRTYMETNELFLEIPKTNGLEVREYLTGAFVQRNAYVDAGLKMWPRVRPVSCNAYNRECPFDEDCDEYNQNVLVAVGDRQLSYSSIADLLLCPEKHRRKSLAPDEREETDSTIFGQAVHKGLEECYRQAKEL